MRVLWVLIFLLPTFVSAQDFRLSDKAEISIITCGPGQEHLYTAFGHSAIRIYDPEYGIDAAFNYGVFDFQQPNFYLNFAKGFLYYKLDADQFENFKYPYEYFNRYVKEQVLDLSTAQKQAIFEALRINSQPKNAHYRYDYFYNNCATKIRDIIADVLKDSVEFDGSYVKTDYTIRQLTDLYLQQQPWGDLGIDICLGLPMDKHASPWDYMFLPEYIESGFDHAFVYRDGKKRPIVKSKVVLYEPRDEDVEAGLPHPFVFFIPFALLSIGLCAYDIKRNKLSLWFDVLVFSVSGIVGWLLFFLWFFTDHNAAARNMNILWAFPLNIIAVFAFIKNPAWLTRYFQLNTILLVIVLLVWALLPQQLHWFLIPVVIGIAARSYAQYAVRKKQIVVTA